MELWSFLLLGLGLVFIVLEVFFPSFGILGTIAAGCIIAGGVFAYRTENDVFLLYLVLAFLLGPTAAIIGLRIFPHTPFGKRLMLAGSTFAAIEAAAGADSDFQCLLGRSGVAQTPLRPSGKAMVDGRRLDVMTRGELIEPGRAIKVVRVEGNRIFVAENQSGPS